MRHLAQGVSRVAAHPIFRQKLPAANSHQKGPPISTSFSSSTRAKLVPVPGQQRQTVAQGDSGSQAVGHTDRLACAVEFSPHCSCPFGRGTIQWQHRQRIQQAPYGVPPFSFRGTTEKLEPGDGCCLDLLGFYAT